jgi:hypothetical protein
MQYNHGVLGLGAVQKGQIMIFLQILFILCWSFRKWSISVTLTRDQVIDFHERYLWKVIFIHWFLCSKSVMNKFVVVLYICGAYFYIWS